MRNWFQRLFGLLDKKPAKPVAPISAEPAAAEIAETEIIQNWQPQADINILFQQWLMNPDSQAATVSADVEFRLLDALDRLAKSELAGADMVPRVPAVIPHLLKSLRDKNVSGYQLSSEIAHDVVLVAEVIKQANSSYYHAGESIASIENAVMVLGQNGLRMLIARVAFRPIVNVQSERFTGVVAPHIWEHAEKCAIACRSLAPEQQLDPFEAFLAGLMQNVGMIVAFRLIDQIYGGMVLPHSPRFCNAFADHARTLSCRIAREWDFPAAVVGAIEEQGLTAPDAVKSALGDVLYVSDQISKMRLLVNAGQLQEDDVLAALGLLDSAIRCFQTLNESELI